MRRAGCWRGWPDADVFTIRVGYPAAYQRFGAFGDLVITGKVDLLRLPTSPKPRSIPRPGPPDTSPLPLGKTPLYHTTDA